MAHVHEARSGAGARCARRALVPSAAVVVLLLLLGAVGVAPVGAQSPAPAPDGGAEAEATPQTLAAAMSGETRGVVARATGHYDLDSFVVTLDVSNTTGTAAALEIPTGTILVSDDESQQALVVAGPTARSASAGGSGSDTVLVAPGRSQVELVAYCAQELDVGPSMPTPLHHAGVALAPLPTVLDNIASTSSADPYTAQDAVWWVTDDPVLPVPSHIRPLLDGVDTAAFAADPVQVVPDDAYTPAWAGGEQAFAQGFEPPDPASAGGYLWVWLMVLAAVGVGVWVLIRRSGRAVQPAEVPVDVPAGWYPDPRASARLRWWDGRGWTDQVGG